MNWERLSPDQQRELAERYTRDLDQFTKNISRLRWNVSVNVMDDADPASMVANYLHMLSKEGVLPSEEPARSLIIEQLIGQVEKADVNHHVSIAHLRNVMKEFFYSGIARVPEAGEVKMHERYKQFDDTEKIVDWKNRLLSVQDAKSFYETLESLLRYMLPLEEDALQRELKRAAESSVNLLRAEDRGEAIEELIANMLTRYFGTEAFEAIKKHMMGERGEDPIPDFNILPRGRSADGPDLGTQLFPFPKDLRPGSWSLKPKYLKTWAHNVETRLLIPLAAILMTFVPIMLGHAPWSIGVGAIVTGLVFIVPHRDRMFQKDIVLLGTGTIGASALSMAALHALMNVGATQDPVQMLAVLSQFASAVVGVEFLTRLHWFNNNRRSLYQTVFAKAA
jgi:hypothetical protein